MHSCMLSFAVCVSRCGVLSFCSLKMNFILYVSACLLLMITSLESTGESSVFLPFLELSDSASVFTGVLDASTKLEFPQPFYFNNMSYDISYISTHGLISFEEEFLAYYPQTFPLSPGNPPVIAPYWNDIDLRNTGNVYYEPVTNLSMISDFITDNQGSSFTCTSAVVVKWSEVCSYANSSCGNLTNSFQVVFASSQYNTSYAIFTYKCGSFNWVYYNAAIGFSGGQDFYANHELSRTSNVNSIACLNEPMSPWSNVVYKVNEGYDKAILNVSSGEEPDMMDDSSTPLPPCTSECNPLSSEIQYSMCCDPNILGEFVRIVESNIHRRYIMCPEELPDWC